VLTSRCSKPRYFVRLAADHNRREKLQSPFPISRLIICNHCHTPSQQGQPREDLAFAGGDMFSQEKRASLNITPDTSGISYFDEKSLSISSSTVRIAPAG
jgi:hypothetical protein